MSRIALCRSVSLLAVVLLAACASAPPTESLTLPDGATYTGELRQGLLHGKGRLQWQNGSYYEGMFRRGVINGEGYLYDTQGCVSEGQFVAGELHGDGKITCEDMNLVGAFEHGKLTTGTLTFSGGSVYEGAFNDDMQFHGDGVWLTEEGERYSGQFDNGELHSGVFENEQGLRYEGEFKQREFHGAGRLENAQGSIIEATFRHGYAQGEGRFTEQTPEGPVTQTGYFVRNKFYDSEAVYRAEREALASDSEARLYDESARLDAAIEALKPQRPGERDIYVLLVGGDGTEGVFAREVEWVAQQLGQGIELEGRQLTLINGGESTQPLATRVSMQRSLQALDGILDPQEDLLIVHFVSHGLSDGSLYLAHPRFKLINIGLEEGQAWFDALRVEHQWLVFSACYSGHWVEALAAPKRIVFSSAASDRTSFGCGDDSERTWFSKALYEGWQRNDLDQPAQWFARAQTRVSVMEEEQGITGKSHSLPQSAIGEAFLQWWQRVETP